MHTLYIFYSLPYNTDIDSCSDGACAFVLRYRYLEDVKVDGMRVRCCGDGALQTRVPHHEVRVRADAHAALARPQVEDARRRRTWYWHEAARVHYTWWKGYFFKIK